MLYFTTNNKTLPPTIQRTMRITTNYAYDEILPRTMLPDNESRSKLGYRPRKFAANYATEQSVGQLKAADFNRKPSYLVITQYTSSTLFTVRPFRRSHPNTKLMIGNLLVRHIVRPALAGRIRRQFLGLSTGSRRSGGGWPRGGWSGGGWPGSGRSGCCRSIIRWRRHMSKRFFDAMERN